MNANYRDLAGTSAAPIARYYRGLSGCLSSVEPPCPGQKLTDDEALGCEGEVFILTSASESKK